LPQVLVEQLTRNIQFFGEESQQRIADAFVIVVGLGVSTAMLRQQRTDDMHLLVTASLATTKLLHSR
jgi:tRNA A37 threonylcarbamoyladenosine dehydratase